MALTPQQQQSVNNSGGYYDVNGNWVDMSGSSGAGQGATVGTGGGAGNAALTALAGLPLLINMLKGQPTPGQQLGSIPGGQDLLNGVLNQQQQQAPLRAALTQQAMNMLPNSAFPGGRTAVPVGTANYAPTAASSSSGFPWGALLAGGGLGAALAALAKSGAGGDIENLIKSLFGHGGQQTVSTPGTPLLPGNPYDVTNPNTFTGFAPQPPLTSDPGVYYGQTGAGATVTDPSGGTGVGPGMSGYYADGGEP